jgi:hypothetical protein
MAALRSHLQAPASPPSGPQPASGSFAPLPADASAGLRLLLQIERDARRARDVRDLFLVMANETRRAVGARQVFVFSQSGKAERLEAVSSVSAIERGSPLSVWIAGCATRIASGAAWSDGRPVSVDLGDLDAPGEAAGTFPFHQALVGPALAPTGRRLGSLMAVRETKFGEAETLALTRLAETYGHAWAALTGGKPPMSARLRRPAFWLGTALGVAMLGMLPAPMTALATVEVAALEPGVVAAPIDGVIEDVAVEPNAPVKTGDLLFRYLDTQSRGALDVAEREVGVAEARLRQAQQMAFVDPQAKRDLAVAQSDLKLKRAERAFAAQMLDRTMVRAPRDGVALFSDKRELLGRPVTTGQRIMDVADPDRRIFVLQVPVEDALILSEGAHARIFMDSNPLSPLSVTIERAAPMARPAENGTLAFRAEAKLEDPTRTPPLGHRGSAQISGPKASVAFILLRRPISALRQKLGL